MRKEKGKYELKYSLEIIRLRITTVVSGKTKTRAQFLKGRLALANPGLRF